MYWRGFGRNILSSTKKRINAFLLIFFDFYIPLPKGINNITYVRIYQEMY